MESNSDNNQDGTVARLPCRHCHGTGYLEVAQCIAQTKNDRRCTLPSRSTTTPAYLVTYADATRTDLPPDFMAYCGLHGNALMRRRKLGRQRALREEMPPHG